MPKWREPQDHLLLFIVNSSSSSVLNLDSFFSRLGFKVRALTLPMSTSISTYIAGLVSLERMLSLWLALCHMGRGIDSLGHTPFAGHPGTWGEHVYSSQQRQIVFVLLSHLNYPE